MVAPTTTGRAFVDGDRCRRQAAGRQIPRFRAAAGIGGGAPATQGVGRSRCQGLRSRRRRAADAARPGSDRARGPIREGVRQSCTCCHDTEHGESGEQVANAVPQVLAPFRLRLSPVHVGARSNRGQYRFVLVPIGNPMARDTEGRAALSVQGSHSIPSAIREAGVQPLMAVWARNLSPSAYSASGSGPSIVPV